MYRNNPLLRLASLWLVETHLHSQVLRDPRQKRFFKAKDMSDLFQLGDQYAQAPETAQIFAGVNSEIPLIEAGRASQLTTPSIAPPIGEELGTEGASHNGTASNTGTQKAPEEEGEPQAV